MYDCEHALHIHFTLVNYKLINSPNRVYCSVPADITLSSASTVASWTAIFTDNTDLIKALSNGDTLRQLANNVIKLKHYV